jgi:hypothetical protein
MAEVFRHSLESKGRKPYMEVTFVHLSLPVRYLAVAPKPLDMILFKFDVRDFH